MVKYIKPKCIPFYYKDGIKYQKENTVKVIAYISSGHILPCCWCDSPAFRPEFKSNGFLDDDLKLSENNSIDDIICSDSWINFLNTLMHEPENAPLVCQRKCGIIHE